jgi:phage baseplate assembly protein W
MEVDVTSVSKDVVFGATGLTEIIQNIRNILATPKGSLPLDREFGLDQTFLDVPQPIAQVKAVPEIIEAVEKYEPRVKVTSVEWEKIESTGTMDGKLVPKVRVELL